MENPLKRSMSKPFYKEISHYFQQKNIFLIFSELFNTNQCLIDENQIKRKLHETTGII